MATSHLNALSKLLPILLMLAVTTGAAHVYRWVDANGKVHFGDAPPVEAKTSEVAPPIGSVGGGQQATKTTATDAASICQQARDKLATYSKATTITQVDGDGKSHDLSGEERQKMLDDENSKINRNCGAETQPKS